MRIGYGTYGMQNEDVFTALPRLKRIGYEAIEFTASEGWPTAPSRIGKDDRRRLASLIEELEFPPPIIMGGVQPCATGPQREETLEQLRAFCELTADLNFSERPGVMTSTLGGKLPAWDDGKERIRVAWWSWRTSLRITT